MLAVSACLFYVFVYTLWLKRTSRQNIVIGGAAGRRARPDRLDRGDRQLAWAPVVLFGVIFFWTPPHFWALAIRYREDYSAASVPMLPSVADDATVGRQIVAYTVVVWALTLLFIPVADMGLLYIGRRRRAGGGVHGPERPPAGRSHAGAGHGPVPLVDHLREPPLRGDGGGCVAVVIPFAPDPLCKVPNRP